MFAFSEAKYRKLEIEYILSVLLGDAICRAVVLLIALRHSECEVKAREFDEYQRIVHLLPTHSDG